MSDRTSFPRRRTPIAGVLVARLVPRWRVVCVAAPVLLAMAGPACHTTRVVAPAVGLRIAVTRRSSSTSAARIETSVAVVAGASARPPLAPVVTQPVAKRRDAHRPAPCRLEALCAWEREAAAVVARVLADVHATPLAPAALGLAPDAASPTP